MDFNNFGGNEPNRRDQLEIGNDGKSTAERKKERQQDQQHQYMDMGKGGMGKQRGGRFRNKLGRGNQQGRRGSGRGTGRGSSAGGVILAIVLIALPFIFVAMLFTGNLNGVMRSVFSTPEQNVTSFNQGVYNVQNSLHDSYLTADEQEQIKIYRKNEISRVEYIDEQVYPEYLVYVYSNSEAKNEPFNEFVLEAEAHGFPVPIFRISADETVNYFITDSIGENEPAFAIYRNNTGEITYDSVVNDPELFSRLDPYMREIIEEDDEYRKNSRGSYGDAEWLNPTPEEVDGSQE